MRDPHNHCGWMPTTVMLLAYFLQALPCHWKTALQIQCNVIFCQAMHWPSKASVSCCAVVHFAQTVVPHWSVHTWDGSRKLELLWWPCLHSPHPLLFGQYCCDNTGWWFYWEQCNILVMIEETTSRSQSADWLLLHGADWLIDSCLVSLSTYWPAPTR